MEELEGFSKRYRFATEAHNGVFILALQSDAKHDDDTKYFYWQVVNYTKVSFTPRPQLQKRIRAAKKKLWNDYRNMKQTTQSYVCGALLPKGAPE